MITTLTTVPFLTEGLEGCTEFFKEVEIVAFDPVSVSDLTGPETFVGMANVVVFGTSPFAFVVTPGRVVGEGDAVVTTDAVGEDDGVALADGFGEGAIVGVGDAEGEGDAKLADLAAREHGGAAAEENQRRRTDEFRDELLHALVCIHVCSPLEGV